MNMKRVGMGGLVVTLLCLGVVRGADLPAPTEVTGGPLFASPPGESATPPAAAVDAAGPAGPSPLGVAASSTWIDYQRCLGCCGPVGGNGPIGYEAYVRNGMDFPIGGNPFGSRLDVGWDVAVGGRTLLFDVAAEKAWTIDLSITNIFNNNSDRTSSYPLFNLPAGPGNPPIPEMGLIIKNLNRTYVNAAVGREWYLWGSASVAKPDTNLRVGVDMGGRYGTEKAEFTNFQHLTDVNAGVFLSVHSDLEVPWGCCIFQAGLRLEYGYTWSDILQQQNDGDIQDMTLMFTTGVRF